MSESNLDGSVSLDALYAALGRSSAGDQKSAGVGSHPSFELPRIPDSMMLNPSESSRGRQADAQLFAGDTGSAEESKEEALAAIEAAREAALREIEHAVAQARHAVGAGSTYSAVEEAASFGEGYYPERGKIKILPSGVPIFEPVAEAASIGHEQFETEAQLLPVDIDESSEWDFGFTEAQHHRKHRNMAILFVAVAVLTFLWVLLIGMVA